VFIKRKSRFAPRKRRCQTDYFISRPIEIIFSHCIPTRKETTGGADPEEEQGGGPIVSVTDHHHYHNHHPCERGFFGFIMTICSSNSNNNTDNKNSNGNRHGRSEKEINEASSQKQSSTIVQKRSSTINHEGEEVELIEEIEYVDPDGDGGFDGNDDEYEEEIVEEYLEEVSDDNEEDEEDVEDEDEDIVEEGAVEEKQESNEEQGKQQSSDIFIHENTEQATEANERVTDLPQSQQLPLRPFKRLQSTGSDAGDVSLYSTDVAVEGVRQPAQGGVELDRLRPHPCEQEGQGAGRRSISVELSNQNLASETNNSQERESLTANATPETTGENTPAHEMVINADDKSKEAAPPVPVEATDTIASFELPTVTSKRKEAVDFAAQTSSKDSEAVGFQALATNTVNEAPTLPIEKEVTTIKEAASTDQSKESAPITPDTKSKPAVHQLSTKPTITTPVASSTPPAFADAKLKPVKLSQPTLSPPQPESSNAKNTEEAPHPSTPKSEPKSPSASPAAPELVVVSDSDVKSESQSPSSLATSSGEEPSDAPTQSETVGEANSASLFCSPKKVRRRMVVKRKPLENDDALRHPKIEWEKPAWTKAQLRSTGKGEVVKKGADLQAPITHIKKILLDDDASPEGKDVKEIEPKGKAIKWEKPDWVKPKLRATIEGEETPLETDSKGKVIGWEKPDWTKPKLRTTAEGEKVKTKGDLQKAITHVEKNTSGTINFEANPMVLRPTDKGSLVRLGENLAKPITHVEKNPMADINFEANPHMLLKETDAGEGVKQGQSLSKPITFAEKTEASDVNFVAHPAILKKTEKGEIVKTKGDLQKAITHVEKDTLDDINFEANPMILRPTPQGSVVRLGMNLGRPITHINKTLSSDVNHDSAAGLVVSSPEGGDSSANDDDMSPVSTVDTNPTVVTTATPIPAATLKPTQRGSLIRTGKEVTRPLTYRETNDGEEEYEEIYEEVDVEEEEVDEEEEEIDMDEIEESEEIVEYVDDSEGSEEGVWVVEEAHVKSSGS